MEPTFDQQKRNPVPAMPTPPGIAANTGKNPMLGDSVKQGVRIPQLTQAESMNSAGVQAGAIGQNQAPTPNAAANPMPGVIGGISSPAAPAPAAVTTAAPPPAGNILNSIVPAVAPPAVAAPVYAKATAPAAAQTVDDGAGGVYTPEAGFNPMHAVRDWNTNRYAYTDRVNQIGGVAARAEFEASKRPAPAMNEQQQQAQENIRENRMNSLLTTPVAAAPAAPAAVAPGRDKNGVITAESAQAVMGADMQRSGGIFGTMDLAGANAVNQRANDIRQSMIDKEAKPAGESVRPEDHPENKRIAESNALLNKWDKQYQTQQMVAEMGRNPKAANAMAALMAAGGHDEANIAGQKMAADTAVRREDTVRRGQDMIAGTEAAKLSGNPLEQALKQEQARGAMTQNDSNAMLLDLQKKALAGDAQAMATYQTLTGKKSPASDRYMAVQGGEEVGPDGMTKIKKPSGVFDAQSGKFVSMAGGQQAGGAVPEPGKREVGKMYQTPKGPMVWRGNGWEAAQQAAPPSAIDYLKKNPSQSEAFKAKYGYLPEGA